MLSNKYLLKNDIINELNKLNFSTINMIIKAVNAPKDAPPITVAAIA